MFYFAEGWWLFKRVWWPTMKLALLSLLLVALWVAGDVLLAFLLGRGWGLLIALVAMLLPFVLGPPVFYTSWAVNSHPYYSEAPIRVWPLFCRGYSRWGRVAGLLLYGLLFSLPILLAYRGLGFSVMPRLGEPFPAQLPPAGWSLAGLYVVLYPLSQLLATYQTFAGQFAVRHDLASWRSWKDAFRLLQGRDWVRTVGLLTALKLLLSAGSGAIGLLLPYRWPPTSFPEFRQVMPLVGLSWLVSLPFILTQWCLSLCDVAIWHRYATGPASEPPAMQATPSA